MGRVVSWAVKEFLSGFGHGGEGAEESFVGISHSFNPKEEKAGLCVQ